jgi:ATP-binding cassette subfamily A (ABC1) protein 1
VVSESEIVANFIRNNFEYSSNAWRSFEKLGRRKAVKFNRKTNPFLKGFSGSVLRSSATDRKTMSYDAMNSNLQLLQAFNGLNSFNDSQCPARRIVADIDPATQALVNSSTKSCFCKTIYVIIASLSEDTQVLFRQIKPMLLGKVMYSPNTPQYAKLIKHANATLANIDLISQMITRSADIMNQFLIAANVDSLKQWSSGVSLGLGQIFNLSNPSLDSLNLTNTIMQLELATQTLYFIANGMKCLELDKFVGFPDEQSAVNAGVQLIKDELFWATVVFQNPEKEASTSSNQSGSLPDVVNYKIRMNASMTHDTTYTQDKIYNFGPSTCLGCNAYFLYGFIYVQDMIERAVVEVKSNQSQLFGLVAQMMPYPCYVNDKFVIAIARSMPLFMVLAWIYTVSMMVKDIVYEKERRLKEFMRVMGLSNGIHWLSWFITSFVIMFVIICLLCIILKYGRITSYSDITCLLVFFICFTIATITQCFFFSIFFDKANLAAVVAGILYFLFYLPYTILVNYDDVILPWQKFLASLSSTVAFSYGCELLAAFELQNQGVTWSTFYVTPFNGRSDGFTMNTVCLILLFDAFIYMTLAWYIEGMFPGEFGIPRKWYFPLQPTYWFGDSARLKKKPVALSGQNRLTNSRSGLVSRCLERLWFDSKEKLIREEEAREAAKRGNSTNTG